MTIKSIESRTYALEHLWEKYHNKKICSILLQQLTSDIIFFLGVPLTKELEERFDKLEADINDYEQP